MRVLINPFPFLYCSQTVAFCPPPSHTPTAPTPQPTYGSVFFLQGPGGRVVLQADKLELKWWGLFLLGAAG